MCYFALKDSCCHRSSIIDFIENEQLIYVYISILMVIVTVCDASAEGD